MSPSMDPLTEALRQLADGRDLDSDLSGRAVNEILSGQAGEAKASALLTAWKVKGESGAELAGVVGAVRSLMVLDGLEPAPAGAIDTCGTGGDGANTLNVSTAAALVVAACEVPVVKHGNRSASGNSGSAEVLTELGVVIDQPPARLNAQVKALKITFLFAPKFHPGLRHAAPVRKALPFRTIFNLVGPLANPARPEYQLVGVPGERQAELVADALVRLGTYRAAVVTGADGLDEVTLSGPTRVRLVESGQVRTLEWSPDDFGQASVSTESLRVSGPEESASRIVAVLEGEIGPARSIIVANAAAALWVARGPEANLSQCVTDAGEAIDSGRARQLLRDWREHSNRAD